MSSIAQGLEIDADRAFQEKQWLWERVGWLLMALLVIAALAGLTGANGPAASGQANAAGATIDYPRIARWQASDTMSIEFAPDAQGRVEVLLPAEFSEIFAIESVTPQPSRAVTTPRGQLYEFELAAESGAKSANFSLRPGRPAFPQSVAGEVAGEPFVMGFTVLP